MKKIKWLCLISFFISLIFYFNSCSDHQTNRIIQDFNADWQFHLGDVPDGERGVFPDSGWRQLDLPHDWSIEGAFSESHPATCGGGALPGGIGWYRKTFTLCPKDSGKLFFIDFDGIYMNSEVWINGHYLAKRPYGYISFRYELTPYISFTEKNMLSVKVDNSLQPNSRWYSGSGIYRNVWLVVVNKLYIDHWGTYITTPKVNHAEAVVAIQTKIVNTDNEDKKFILRTSLINKNNVIKGKYSSEMMIKAGQSKEERQSVVITNPNLWSIENPDLYKAVSEIICQGEIIDKYETTFGIRYFEFKPDKGFFLNGQPVKIKGVCNHHDLGCLGAAINIRALERQLEILKMMGCNAIRTSHNPPAPELLNLCDKMGFIVMDEAFDMWKKKKTPFDYSLYWDEWYVKDLQDFMKRDRNHPSVIIWSIGNEILEQWDTSGIRMVKELYNLAREMDTSRPITTANNPAFPENNLNKPMVLDLIGYNYAQGQYADFPNIFPGQKFIATETNSALATRGHYDMPSDSIKRWPAAWDQPLKDGNPDHTVSAYDHVSAPWGSTHEETWDIIRKYDYLSGMFIWTGFDYLGEPTPYWWPSRSSYFGVIDLAGFPKDAYYMYQSEWTTQPVLHVFPHWNWKEGDSVDIWAYTNYDEVELFLNDKSMGLKSKGDKLHIMWRIKYEPGTVKAIAKKEGQKDLVKMIHTSGKASQIQMVADRSKIKADGKDLSFVTVKILDNEENLVPDANNLVYFEVSGAGKIKGVDNGDQTSLESFKANHRKAFNGLCLLVISSTMEKGDIIIKASSEGLKDKIIKIESEIEMKD